MFLLFCLTFITDNLLAQSHTGNYERKGDLFFYWGWNRGFFTNSDIHFKGPGYNFTLENVESKDRPEKVDFETYANPSKLTIPQTNFRIGFFINDHYSVSIGFDHMKYVVVQNQTVKIDGYIDGTGTSYDGEYSDNDIQLTRSFLRLEHTDGLNYINVEFRRFDQLFEYKNISLNISEGVGVGALVPRTAASFINYPRNDNYHLSGYGFNLSAALNLTFFNHFFLQTEGKLGFIDMPSVKFTNTSVDRASQNFFFSQLNFVFGFQFNLIKPDKSSK